MNNKLVKPGIIAFVVIGTACLGFNFFEGNVVPKSAIAQTRVATQSTKLESVLLKDIPHIKQKSDFCGEACSAMYLNKLGYKVDQDYVFDQSGLDPSFGRGCYTKELKTSLARIGFDIGSVWYQVNAAKSGSEINTVFRDVHAKLKAGIPSILCTHFDDSPNTTEHFRLIVGYDREKDEVIYHDPALDRGSFLRMSRQKLFELWPLKYDEKHWTLIYMPLIPKTIKVEKTKGYTDADFAQHVMKLKKRLPGKGFHILIQKPFVVIGDESPERVKQRSINTVKWAVDHLKKRYFEKDPDEIIDVWLFKDKASYEKNCEKLIGRKPTTPYGFYTSRHDALIMNISTGGGTLVHEIVHPFIASNFPKCPSWFNEGLASLYEQCGTRDGVITGKENWRLRGLQLAIKDNRVPSFAELCGTSTDEFYGEDRGTNYSQARYLCFYLQEKGLLLKYYQEFSKNVDKDPSGYKSLQKILKRTDMDKFKKDWESFVAKLRF